MRIKAAVQLVTGKTVHYVGGVQHGVPVGRARIPPPAWVEIVEDSGAFYLLHYNLKGECVADTWHETLVEAKQQAEFEFAIKETDWLVM